MSKYTRTKEGKFAGQNLVMPSKRCLECEIIFYKNPKYSKSQWLEQSCCSKKCQFNRHGKLILSNFVPVEDYKLLSRSKTSRRNTRLRINGGYHSQGEWETLKAQYNWTCAKCGESEPNICLTKDHIIPVIRGGSDNIENIQPLCKPCNSEKGTTNVKYSIIN